MPLLRDLYKKHIGQDIYIVGTGPTLRLFPLEFLKNKITIGLNQSFLHFDPTYSLTIHPYIIPLDRKTWNTKWITKVKPSDETWNEHSLRQNDKSFYLIKNGLPTNFDYLNPAKKPDDGLYVGCGIHTAAMHLGCLMGAKCLYLLGCDMGSLNNQHHAHDQHIEPHNHSITSVYNEYFFYAVKTRELLQQYYRVHILNLSASFGIPHHAGLEFKHAKLELLPTPKIIEKKKRETPLVTDFID